MKFPIALADSVIEEYAAKGFVVTPEVFTPTQLTQCAKAVDAEVAQRAAFDTRKVSEKSTYEQSFIQCMRLWETSAAVAEFSCHEKLAGIAAQLMSQAGVRLWQDQALYKEPGGRETDAHQDQTFWPIGDTPLISAWIPFQDVTIENGAMAYVPGSHKPGPLRVVDITHSTKPYEILKDPALNGQQPQWVSVKAGSIIWHNGFTVHQAAANTSAHTRRVFTVVYIADGYSRTKAWPAFPLDRAGVKPGELMQGDGLPLLWPTPKTLPEAPKTTGVAVGPQAI